MTHIRPLDLVRLKHTPERFGLVLVVADDFTLVDLNNGVLCWLPIEFLELVPEQIEELAA